MFVIYKIPAANPATLIGERVAEIYLDIYIYTAFLPACLPSFLACIHDTRVHARMCHLFTFQVSLETRTNKTSECVSSARKMCLTITYDNVHERAIQRLLHLCVFVFFGK